MNKSTTIRIFFIDSLHNCHLHMNLYQEYLIELSDPKHLKAVIFVIWGKLPDSFCSIKDSGHYHCGIIS